MGKRGTTATAAVVIALLGMAVPAGAGGDANGDGLDDVAIGVPGQDVGGDDSAGQVVVLPSGGTVGAVSFNSDTSGVIGTSEPGDQLGRAVAWGDFNGDGFDDLAVGNPFEDVGTLDGAGAVTVLPGSASGVVSAGSKELSENTTGMAGTAEAGDFWGHALATGDINGDGFDDLVVGAYKEDIGTAEDAGAITVVPGSAAGLTTTGSTQKTQASAGVPSDAADFEEWGYQAIATGDFDGDGFADIAIGSRTETVGTVANAGQVTILRGSVAGLTTAGSMLVNENSSGVVGSAEASDFWSDTSVASGNFNGDGFDDLVVGAGDEGAGSVDDAGAITILLGSATGITGTGSKQISSDTSGVTGVSEVNDHLGRGTSGVGDFNGDGFDDVAASIAYQLVNGHAQAGAILVLNGSPSGITVTGSKEISLDTRGVAGTAGNQEYFGFNGSVGAHLRAGLYDDLVVGVPFTASGTLASAGAIVILRGSASGLTGTGSVELTESSSGVPGTSAASDIFGWAVG